MQMLTDHLTETAEAAINQIEIATMAVIEFRRKKFLADQVVEDELDALVNSLLGQPNAATNRAHSVESATKAAKLTEQYRAKEIEKIEAQNTLSLAESKLEQVRLRAKLAVFVVGAV